jgi:hypothetical protein
LVQRSIIILLRDTEVLQFSRLTQKWLLLFSIVFGLSPKFESIDSCFYFYKFASKSAKKLGIRN